MITTVGNAHLDIFGSVPKIAKAKSEIYEGLIPKDGMGVFNLDNRYTKEMHDSSDLKNITTYTVEGIKNADYSFEEIVWKSNSDVVFTLKTDDRISKFNASLIGKQNIHSLFPAIVLAESMGLERGQDSGAIWQITCSLSLISKSTREKNGIQNH